MEFPKKDKNLINKFFDSAIYLAQEPVNSNVEITLWGSNKKKTLIIVSDPSKEFLSEASDELMEKILSAVGYSKDDVALVNLSGSPLGSFTNLRQRIDFDRLIAFGPSADEIGIKGDFQSNRVHNFYNKRILFTDSLEALSGDTRKKQLLWKALKEMFEV